MVTVGMCLRRYRGNRNEKGRVTYAHRQTNTIGSFIETIPVNKPRVSRYAQFDEILDSYTCKTTGAPIPMQNTRAQSTFPIGACHR